MLDLFMDDDDENVNIARQFGHLVYLVQETVTLEDIYSFVKGIKECDVSRSNSDCHFIHLFLKTAIWRILL